MSDIRWGSIIPLIGGLPVANSQVTGTKPEVILSYSGFGGNDVHCAEYFKDTPYIQIDKTPDFDPTLYENLDFISATCPCAGLSNFSSSTNSKVRENSNQWMYHTADYVLGTLKPKVFWGENAPGLFTSRGQHVADFMEDAAKKYGYSLSLYKTNTFLHGIPQHRHRTFYFFWKSETAPIMEMYNRPSPNFADYIDQVPKGVAHHTDADIKDAKDRLHKSSFYPWLKKQFGENYHESLHAWMKDREWSIATPLKIARRIDHYEGMLQTAKEAENEKLVKNITHIQTKLADGKGYWDGSFTLIHPEAESNTLIARSLTMVHPREDRYMTTRELMHLMALPHDFKLQSNELNHICQNVPVCTASDMTREVIGFLKGERQMSTSSFTKCNNVTKKQVSVHSTLIEY